MNFLTLTSASLAIVVVMVSGLAVARHDHGCVFTSADPSTYNVIVVPPGRTFYVEERPAVAVPAVPLIGFVLAGETWIFEESNGLTGLQRAGMPLSCIPPVPICLLGMGDPVSDNHCGHGPDIAVVGLASPIEF